MRKIKPEAVPGAPAPEFSLKDLDGRAHQLADYRGKILLLVFWSAECSWSDRVDKLIQPRLAAWGPGVVYLPVASNANESPAEMRAAAQARGVAPVLWDETSAVANRYGAEITPQFYVIDPDGTLRYSGAYDDINFRRRTATRCYIEEVVSALLAGRAPQTDHTAPYGCTIVRFTNLVA